MTKEFRMLQKTHKEYLAFMISVNDKSPEDELKILFHGLRFSTENNEMTAEDDDTSINDFCRILSDLFSVTDDGIQVEIRLYMVRYLDRYEELYGGSEFLWGLYHYALCQELEESSCQLMLLKETLSPFARFYAAKITSKSKSVDKDECVELFRDGFEILHGYRHLAEFYMSIGDNVKAGETCEQAIEHLKLFTGKERTFFHKTMGQQARDLRAKGISESVPEKQRTELLEQLSVVAQTLDLEELAAVDLKIRFFQNQLEILEEAISEEKTRFEAQKPTVTTAISHTLKDEPNASNADEASLAALTLSSDPDVPVEDLPSGYHSDEFTTVVKKRPARQSNAYIRRVLNDANTQATAKNYTDAEKKLVKLRPKEHSVEWYRKEQTLCWIKHSQATDHDYLTQHQSIGKPAEALARELMENSKKHTITLINLLTGLITTPISPVIMDEVKCIQIAEQLEAIDPGLRAQFGGLYSVLGHLQKAYRGACTSYEDRIRFINAGITYYTLANLIRRRPVE